MQSGYCNRFTVIFVYLENEENTQEKQNQNRQEEDAGGHVGVYKQVPILTRGVNLKTDHFKSLEYHISC